MKVETVDGWTADNERPLWGRYGRGADYQRRPQHVQLT